MQINIKTTDLEFTPELYNYTQKKLLDVERLAGENMGEISAQVELARANRHHKQGEDIFYAEVNLMIKGKLYRATADASSIHAAIDKMRDEIMKEVKRDFSKQETLVRKGAAKVKEWMRWGKKEQ